MFILANGLCILFTILNYFIDTFVICKYDKLGSRVLHRLCNAQHIYLHYFHYTDPNILPVYKKMLDIELANYVEFFLLE